MKLQIESHGIKLQNMTVFSGVNGKFIHAAEIAMFIVELEKWKKKFQSMYEKKANIIIKKNATSS
ncbi:hypothetical protein LCGC14_3005150 [marine sediment metagenome]|uniref:Uncharacterized protein n=1 Tax=marine sediment metagenome TaxID=412755 RepID=A0A0F8XML8_9ZZZZ